MWLAWEQPLNSVLTRVEHRREFGSQNGKIVWIAFIPFEMIDLLLKCPVKFGSGTAMIFFYKSLERKIIKIIAFCILYINQTIGVGKNQGWFFQVYFTDLNFR